MMSTIDSVPSGPSQPLGNRRRRKQLSPTFRMPGWGFALMVGLWLLFLIVFGLLVVVSATYLNSQPANPERWLDRGWALLSALALVWAVVNLVWARQAMRALDPLAIYGHFAMAIGCGLIAVGTHSVLFARALGTQPIVMDYTHTANGRAGAGNEAAVVPPVQGDAEEGRKIFSTTCVTCHGPTGGGMPNLAPSLRGSPFVASADDVAVSGVIRLGRPVGDPLNKSGKVMPARGGNPFLGDDKIAHLVAFIRNIQTEGVGGGSAEQDPNAAPAVQLSKWVVPSGPSPPSGLVKLAAHETIGDEPSINAKNSQRRQQLIQTLTLCLTGLHGLFLFGVMIVSSNVLVRRLVNRSSKADMAIWEVASIGWIIALVTWLIVFFYGFVWLA